MTDRPRSSMPTIFPNLTKGGQGYMHVPVMLSCFREMEGGGWRREPEPHACPAWKASRRSAMLCMSFTQAMLFAD